MATLFASSGMSTLLLQIVSGQGFAFTVLQFFFSTMLESWEGHYMRWLMLYLDMEQTHGTWYIGLTCQSISTHNSKMDVHAIWDEVSPLNSVRWILGLEICPGYSDIQKG
jgi:hypothetical protein